MNDYRQETNEQLKTIFLNARTTSARCLGHHKGERNDAIVKKAREELERRGLPVPGWDETGQFNGPGSY